MWTDRAHGRVEERSNHQESKMGRICGPIGPAENAKRDILDGNEEVSNMKWKWRKILKD